jgi:predicted anti-sigma-YlaC factor YlaD
MHEPVKSRLEEYLRGGARFADVDEHLKNCEGCRNEVNAMRAQSELFRAVKAPVNMEPGAGFYARVMNRIETEAKPSPWSLFGESLFAKRLVYASATFLVLLGTFLVSSTETDNPMAGSAAEMILAGQQDLEPVTMEDPQKDREVVLVNLATFEQGYQ